MELLPAILPGYAVGSLPIGYLVTPTANAEAITTALLLPAMEWSMPGPRSVDSGVKLMAAVILLRHRGNVARLWSRMERAVGT